MTKELTTYDDDAYIREMQEAGMYVPKDSGGFIPRLSIQAEPFDNADNPVPRGTFTIMDPATGTRVYATTVAFRPYVKRNQYTVYDAKTNTYPNKSALFTSWAETIQDEKGGERCGKVVGKDKKQLTEAEVEQQKKIKLASRVWGTVTLDGVDKDKNKIHVQDAPCELKLQGTNYTTLDESFKSVVSMGKLPHKFEFSLTLAKKNNPAGKAYYNVVATIADPTSDYTLNDFEQGLKRDFMKLINDENTAVRAKYSEVHSLRIRDMEDKHIIDTDFDELNDDISDLGITAPDSQAVSA